MMMNIALKNSIRNLFCTSFVNYYNVMGLQPTATQEQIKDRYLKLAKKMHPDVVGDNKSSHQKFAKINQAYEVLRDQKRRRIYDQRMQDPGKCYSERQTYRDRQTYGEGQEKPQWRTWADQQNSKTSQSYHEHMYSHYHHHHHQARQFRIIKAFALLMAFPALIYVFFMRKGPTQHQIRRQNVILSRQNIDSRPSTIQTRYRMYMEEMKKKQFRMVEFQRELNRYGNAWISESDMKDPSKMGRTYTTIKKKKKGLDNVEGIKKKTKPIFVSVEKGQTYM